jgi:hypothetical protein
MKPLILSIILLTSTICSSSWAGIDLSIKHTDKAMLGKSIASSSIELPVFRLKSEAVEWAMTLVKDGYTNEIDVRIRRPLRDKMQELAKKVVYAHSIPTSVEINLAKDLMHLQSLYKEAMEVLLKAKKSSKGAIVYSSSVPIKKGR